MKPSEITELLNPTDLEFKDPDTLRGPELLEQIAALDRRVRRLRRLRLELLEELERRPGVFAAQPELQEELDYLRALDPEEVSAPGS